MRVQQRRTAEGVGLVNQQLDRRAGGCFNGKPGPADDLLGQLKRQRGAPATVQFHAPLTGRGRGGYIAALSTESVRNTEIEVVLRRGAPFQPARLSQFGGGHQ